MAQSAWQLPVEIVLKHLFGADPARTLPETHERHLDASLEKMHWAGEQSAWQLPQEVGR
jgi:hypothetical protein